MVVKTSLAAALSALALGALALGAPALVAGPAAAQPPTGPEGERVALADQIYAMIGRQTMDAVGQAIKSSMVPPFKAMAGQDPTRAQALQAALSDSVDDMMPKMMRATARIMADDFSVEELRGMLAFYQSPTGQAVLQKMPEITQQSMQIGQGLIPDFMRHFEGDYCGRVTCTTQEQQVFAQINARLAEHSAAQR